MAYTAPKTFVAGAVLTAAELNTHIRDQFLYLAGSTGRIDLSTVSKHISHDSLIIKILGI